MGSLPNWISINTVKERENAAFLQHLWTPDVEEYFRYLSPLLPQMSTKIFIVSSTVAFKSYSKPLRPPRMNLSVLLFLRKPLLCEKLPMIFPTSWYFIKIYRCDHLHRIGLMCISEIIRVGWSGVGGIINIRGNFIFPDLYEPCRFPEKSYTTHIHAISGGVARKHLKSTTEWHFYQTMPLIY